MMLLSLHGDLWQINRQRIVHLVILQILFDHQSDELAVSILMNLASSWVLPLETCILLRICVSIVLYCLEHLGSQLCPQGPESSLLLQVLNDNIFQVVHLRPLLNLSFKF